MRSDQTRTLLIATLLGVCLLVGGMTWADPVFCDTFDAEKTGDPPSLWDEGYAGPGGSPAYDRAGAAALGVSISVDKDVYYGPSGKSVHFYDTNTAGVNGALRRSFSPLSSLRVEYYMLTGNKDYSGVQVYLAETSGPHYWVFFSNGADGGTADRIGVWNPFGTVVQEFLPYTEDTWYYVRHDVDYMANTATLYVEDTVTHDNNSYAYAPNAAPDTLYAAKLEMATGNYVGSDAYIDEVCVSGTVVPEPFSMAFMGSAFVGVVAWRVRRRRRRDA